MNGRFSLGDDGDPTDSPQGRLGEKVRLVAPAKLTLSLRMVGRRADGLHLIEAEMVTLDLHDSIEIDSKGEGLAIKGGGIDIPAGADNLVLRAMSLAGRTAGVALTKRIPSQAGLGGGSSDAGAILRWAGFDPTSEEDLLRAASLGADVAFCLVGGRARVSGIGERVEPLPHLDMDLTLVTPPVPCPTPEVYRAWDHLGGPRNYESPNDLEAAALTVAPELTRWRDELAEESGQRPTLAGSGSTWFVRGHFPGPRRLTTKTTRSGWSPSTC